MTLKRDPMTLWPTGLKDKGVWRDGVEEEEKDKEEDYPKQIPGKSLLILIFPYLKDE